MEGCLVLKVVFCQMSSYVKGFILSNVVSPQSSLFVKVLVRLCWLGYVIQFRLGYVMLVYVRLGQLDQVSQVRLVRLGQLGQLGWLGYFSKVSQVRLVWLGKVSQVRFVWLGQLCKVSQVRFVRLGQLGPRNYSPQF